MTQFVRNTRSGRVFKATPENIKHKHCELLDEEEIQALGILDDHGGIVSKTLEPERQDPNVWVIKPDFDPFINIDTMGKPDLLGLIGKHPAFRHRVQTDKQIGKMRQAAQLVLNELRELYSVQGERDAIDPNANEDNGPVDAFGMPLDEEHQARVTEDNPYGLSDEELARATPDNPMGFEQLDDEKLDAYGEPLDEKHIARVTEDNPYGLSGAALKRVSDENPMGLTENQLIEREAAGADD